MIRLSGISLASGEFRLPDVTFEIGKGEYAVLMGPTGCGKTSILETICGLKMPVQGSIWIDETDVTNFLPGDRRVGYVPQDIALFPTMSVGEHLEFGLRLRRFSRQEIRIRCDRAAELLGITHLWRRRVQNLSGGEAQRVALGRAITWEPSVLLLDEPFSALDEKTRGEMQTMLMSLQRMIGVTTLHVTHNPVEAESLADRRFQIIGGKFLESPVKEDRDANRQSANQSG